MSIQTMITSFKNNKRSRNTAFDKKIASGGFGEFVDHKKMKTYEFAEFQKKMFKQKRIQKKEKNPILHYNPDNCNFIYSINSLSFRFYF
jgi:hypothetical protein